MFLLLLFVCLLFLDCLLFVNGFVVCELVAVVASSCSICVRSNSPAETVTLVSYVLTAAGGGGDSC